ncbi:response regulator [Dyadobacter sp. CY326]|uniref:response regulator n=1 Tax=Dyadobacter sp. CY326 TaxID=2907300 RepID=UPI001F4251D5|nr:response regulator [Dyadobacter sp. CY326]MCE7065040.1 response regulator [Dyadobacter sp. CY326]
MSQNIDKPDSKVILVVDDNRDAATTLGMFLKVKGYQTHTRFSGQDALDAVEAHKPDLVILDLAMPDMDGYETATLIREKHGQSLSMIALSGYGQEEDKRRTAEVGFDAHLVKPVDFKSLMDMLDNVLK